MECPGQWMKGDPHKDIQFWSFRIESEGPKSFSREEPGHIGRIRIRITSDFSLAMLGPRGYINSEGFLYLQIQTINQRRVLKKCTGKV